LILGWHRRRKATASEAIYPIHAERSVAAVKILKAFALLVILTPATILALAWGKSDVFEVARSLEANAPQEKLFALVNDLKRWQEWSPYESKDPKMNRTFSGAESGAGAAYDWKGDENVGRGRMEIAESEVPRRVVVKLKFFEPFEAENLAEFNFVPRGEKIKISWRMEGAQPFIGKVMRVLFDVDGLIGKDFEHGLKNLEAAAQR
jgi:hypothetical protein